MYFNETVDFDNTIPYACCRDVALGRSRRIFGPQVSAARPRPHRVRKHAALRVRAADQEDQRAPHRCALRSRGKKLLSSIQDHARGFRHSDFQRSEFPQKWETGKIEKIKIC